MAASRQPTLWDWLWGTSQHNPKPPFVLVEGAGKVAKGDMFEIGNQDLDDDHPYKRVTI